jgi:hypothetical protein
MSSEVTDNMLLGPASQGVGFDELTQFGFMVRGLFPLPLSTMGCHFNSNCGFRFWKALSLGVPNIIHRQFYLRFEVVLSNI